MATPQSTTFSEAWRSLVWENPMAIEVSRFRRKFFESGRGKTVNSMVLVVAIIAYAAMLLVVANLSGDLPPVAIIHVQTGVFTLIGPAIMFGAIAGERERRSWDLLLAAPITHAQIVMGKFLAGLAALAGIFAMFLVPTLFTLRTYEAPLTQGPVSMGRAFVDQELLSLSFGVCVLALTLFFSARCRRSLMALGITLTTLFVTLIALPGIAAVLAGGRGSAADLFVLFHPFMALERVDEFRTSFSASSSLYHGYDFLDAGWWGAPQMLMYLGFAALFIVWALKTVNFADGEKKFIPKARPNA